MKLIKQNVTSIKNMKHFNNLILKNKKITILKFETKWCGACKAMIPIYKKLANRYKKQIYFAKVDIQKISKLASIYKLKGVPTFLFFRDGKIVDKIVGSISEHSFENILKKFL